MIKAVSIYTDEYMSAMMRHIRSDAKRKRRFRDLVIRTAISLIVVSLALFYYLWGMNIFTPLVVAFSARLLVDLWFKWDCFRSEGVSDKQNGQEILHRQPTEGSIKW